MISCLECIFWRMMPNQRHPSTDPRLGNCHCKAPVGPFPVGRDLKHLPFPVTRELDFCGDAEKKPAEFPQPALL